MIFRIIPESLINKLAKFSGIGLINTSIHASIVVCLVEKFFCHPAFANAAAFVIANIFSYWANQRWNFKTSGSIKRYGRFLTVSLVGLGITVLVSSAANWAGWHYLVGLGLVFVALPIFTFVLHYRWTFKP